MWLNYLKIVWRDFTRQGLYSWIKMLGLSVGIAASLLLLLYIYEDLSFDAFHSKKGRIVRVITIDKAQGVETSNVGVSQAALGPSAVADIPEVIANARLSSRGEVDLLFEQKAIQSEGVFLTETSFFDLFDFSLIKGDPKTVLDEPHTAVVTQSLANRMFGEQDPMGKVFRYDNQYDLRVTGVTEDPPHNSHLQFDMLRSLVAPPDQPGWQGWLTSWSGISMYTYLLLDEPRPLAELNTKLDTLARRHGAYEMFVPTAQYLGDMHLHSKKVIYEQNHNKSDITALYALGTVSLLIVLLAIINYINLVTAKSIRRAKEVGIRKVAGARKGQLIFQHMLESGVVTLVAFLAAIAMVSMALPWLNSLYGREASLDYLTTPGLMIGMGLLFLGTSLLAGLYPALVLSSFRPVQVLKGSFSNSKSGVWLRKGLVVLQFAISVGLIIGTGVVYQQMDYIFNRDMGYDRDQVVLIQSGGNLPVQLFLNELEKEPAVLSVGGSSGRMGYPLGRTRIYPEGASESDNFITSVMSIDENYIPTMDMKLAEGRNFSRDFPSDSSSAMIINEAMARMMNWDKSLNKTIRLSAGPDSFATYRIVGIVKDFNFATLHQQIEPIIITYNPRHGMYAVKLQAEKVQEGMIFMENTWGNLYPNAVFNATFMDDDFAQLYANEQEFSRMIGHFTLLADLIAILGLFALSAFTANQRRKELAVRKILGASVGGLTWLFTSDFLKLVGISILIAIPFAYFATQQWLENFVYKMEVGPWIFILSGLLALIIAILVVSFQSLRAAMANPVISLRDE